MYNIDFLPQLEESRRRLFGSLEPGEAVEKISNYSPPVGAKVIKCVEDVNGEFVPVRVLEKAVRNS
jgi:hypothetical protein